MLQKILYANASFSLLSSIFILTQTSYLQNHIPLVTWMWMVIGVGLLLFSIALFYLAHNEIYGKKYALLVIFADIFWIVITAVAYCIFTENVTVTGGVIISVIDTLIALFALLQYKGYRNLS